MIQASRLSKAYGRQVIFDDVSFTVSPGERIGLVGRNGSGKTTLFRLIIGEERPDDGVIGIPNDYRIGHLSQHTDFTKETVLGEGCLHLGTGEDGKDESYRVKAILLGLGFSEDDFPRSPWALSSGYQVRLNLAKLLITEPNLLLLDEPTNYLDIVSIRWLARFLRYWRNELIVITHDRSFMDSVTTHTMGIHRGKVRKVAGPTGKYYDQILLEEEVYEKTRLNDEKRRKEVEQFINRFRAQATRARAVQSKIKALGKREKLDQLTQIRTLDFSFTSAPFAGKWLLDAEDVAFTYAPPGPLLFEGLNLTVAKGDRIGIIGMNGKGKTTLLNVLAGELPPVRGEVRRHPHMKLGHFSQTKIDLLDPGATVEEEVQSADPSRSRTQVRTVCGIMMFDGDNALKKISLLSGGERSRVALGKLLATPSNLLLLDEPTNHLDMESVDALLEALDDFDGAIIIVTHSEMILKAVATRLVVFDDGTVRVFEGTYEDFLNRIGWQQEETKPAEGLPAERDRKAATRKDLRRMRADIITRRSKALGSLKERIAAAEEEIVRLEKETDRDTNRLVIASEKGNWQELAGLSKSIHEAKERIDRLFGELADLTDEHDARAKEFEAELLTCEEPAGP